jgi:predicted PurR-regulated permease PerM
VLAIDRQAARVTWTVLFILLLCLLLYLLWHTLLVFIMAVLLAYLLSPVVDLLNRVLPARRSQTAALAIVYLLLVGGLVVLAITVGSGVVDQAASLAAKFPDLLARLQHPENLPIPESLRGFVPTIAKQIEVHSKDWLTYLPTAGMEVLSVASNVIYVVIVPILSFFFLKDGRALLAGAVETLSDVIEPGILQDISADVHVLLGQYMRALVILSAATFVFYFAFLSIIGAPYGLLLAALAAPLEFIPVVGPLIAAVMILSVSALGGSSHLLAILIFLGAYRLFQDYMLQPALMSAGVELHPIVVLFGAFAGGQIAGVPGTFLSVPAMATLRIIYRRLRSRRRETRLSPVAPVTETP